MEGRWLLSQLTMGYLSGSVPRRGRAQAQAGGASGLHSGERGGWLEGYLSDCRPILQKPPDLLMGRRPRHPISAPKELAGGCGRALQAS